MQINYWKRVKEEKEWCIYLYGHPYVKGKKNLFSYLVAFLQGAF